MGTSTLTPSGWDNKAAGASRMAATLDPTRHMLVGQSPRMRQVMRMAEKLGKCRWPVLLLGETGAGKEVVARAVHQVENVGPFVTIDCSSMVGPLMESELFGHVKGAFTGAAGAKVGLIEHANGGTAFFDEIGELPLDLQAKLLRVIQEKEFRPVGSLFHRRSDFRVIAATNRDLAKEVEKGTFRRDLYYRLNVVSLRLPPLRERKEDVPSLIAHFLERCGGTHRLTQEALEAMLAYEWPGNVRELENCIQHTMAVNSGPLVHVTDLPSSLQHWLAQRNGQYRAAAAAAFSAGPSVSAEITQPAPEQPDPRSPADSPVVPLVELERKAIMQALQYTRGDRATAATLLGIGRTTLYRKLKEYRIAG